MPQSVTVFEIYAPEHRVLTELVARRAAPPELSSFLADPRVQLRFEDGRNALTREPARYDVIEMDALWPYSPFAGNLYSVGFLETCRARLAPGGLMCCWAPSSRVRASFCASFPHVVELAAGRILVGSQQPIQLARRRWHERLLAPGVVAHLGAERAEQVWTHLKDASPVNDPPAPPDALNHDLFPRDEYLTPSGM